MAEETPGIPKLSVLNMVGILSVFCCMSEFTILTPSIAAFSHHFAGTPITTIMLANSITGIISVPISILSGALLRRVGFKPIALIGILIMSLGGAFPFLMPNITNYAFVIFSRILVGIGLGIMFPVGTATIIAFTSDDQRSRMLGWSIAVQFFFSLIYTTVAGFLTEIGWNYSFLAYLIGILPFVCVLLWMPEAKPYVNKASERDADMASKLGQKESIPHSIWAYALYGLLIWTAVVTVQVVTSTVLDSRGLAAAGEAALVINCCGIGQICSGLLLPYIIRLFKGRTFGVMATLVVVGILPVLLVKDSAIIYAIGVFIMGFGGGAFFTCCQNATGNIAPRTRSPFVSGVMMSMENLGPFIGPYIFSATLIANPAMGNDAVFPVLIGMALVGAVIGLAHPMKALSEKPVDEGVE